MKLIRDLRREEKAIFGFIMYFCENLGRKPGFVLCKEQELELNSFLYNKYILASFPGSSGLCGKKAILCWFYSILNKK